MTTTPKSSNPLASPHVSSHLGFQVSRLARAAGLTPADRDDLRQDLSLAVVQARRNFRPELGPPEAFDLGALNLAYCEQARAIRRRRERKPTPCRCGSRPAARWTSGLWTHSKPWTPAWTWSLRGPAWMTTPG